MSSSTMITVLQSQLTLMQTAQSTGNGSKLWSIKNTGHYIIGNNLVKREPIFITFALLRRKLHFQRNPCNISHFTLTMVPHYLGKFKRVGLICRKNQVRHYNPLKQDNVTSENNDLFLILKICLL